MGFAIAGAAVAGAAMSSSASQNAANTAAGAAGQSLGESESIWASNARMLAPYYNSGTQNLNTLNSMMPSLTQNFSAQQYQQSPGYAWQLQQGQNAVQASAAAKGMLNSTGTQQNLMSYSQGLANQDYQQALQNYMAQNQQTYNMYNNLSQQGQNAAIQQGSTGAQLANTMSNSIMAGGNAQAAGIMGQASAINNGLTGVGNAYSNQQTMNQFQQMYQNQNQAAWQKTYAQNNQQLNNLPQLTMPED
jgi:hypothetical protein